MNRDVTFADFRARLAAALFAPADTSCSAPFDQPGFAVYRNTARRGAIEALVANYPTVGRIVGEEWLQGAAAVYVESHWPRSPVLLDYGADFPAFLADFPPAAAMPYLPEIARIDRAWTECHLAADAPVLALHELAAVGDGLAVARLRLHPAARWVWCDEAPAFELWQRHREMVPLVELAWQPDGGLLTRPDGAVRWQPLARGAVTLLDACAQGALLAEALDLAQRTAHESLAPAALLAPLVTAGAFTSL